MAKAPLNWLVFLVSILRLGGFLLVFLTISSAFGLTKIIDNGPNDKLVVILIMGSGFTAAQQPKFDSLSKLVTDSIFAFTPYRQYASFFNVYRVNLVSQNSGVFDVDNNKVQRVIADSIGSCAVSIVIVNDPNLDGGNWEGTQWCYFGLIPDVYINTCRHELGHAFANLADEYVSPPGNTSPITAGPEPNFAVAPDTTPETVKWAAWVTSGVEWPTTSTIRPNPVGLYPGSKYTYAAYRPERSCIMRLGYGPYCRICTEAIVWRIKEIVKEIDSPTYPRNAHVGYTNTPVEFNIGLLGTQELKYDNIWYLDGNKLIGETANNFSLNPIVHNLGTTTHILKAIAKDTSNYRYGWTGDTSTFVKYDPRHLMNDTIQWTLEYGIGIEQRTLEQVIPTLSVRREASGVRITTNPQGEYNLGVYNIHGQRVAELGQGFSRVTRDFTYAPRSAGVYFVRLIANKKQYMNKVVFFR